MITARKRQCGFTIVAALFLLVVLAVLGAFIVTVSTTQHAGAALDVQGTETYRAARSGIEWGVYNVLKPVTSCSLSTDIGVVPTSTVAGMEVTVTCNPVPADEQGAGTIYAIAATACNLPNAGSPKCPNVSANPHYVERRIAVMVEK